MKEIKEIDRKFKESRDIEDEMEFDSDHLEKLIESELRDLKSYRSKKHNTTKALPKKSNKNVQNNSKQYSPSSTDHSKDSKK